MTDALARMLESLMAETAEEETAEEGHVPCPETMVGRNGETRPVPCDCHRACNPVGCIAAAMET